MTQLEHIFGNMTFRELSHAYWVICTSITTLVLSNTAPKARIEGQKYISKAAMLEVKISHLTPVVCAHSSSRLLGGLSVWFLCLPCYFV